MEQQSEYPTLLQIDGLNIVRRVYEAIPADDSVQKVEGALKSSLSSILRALREHRPTHALASFDTGGPNWRHQIYPEYRAGRKPMAQVLRDALPDFELKLWNDYGLANIAAVGVEADDVIAAVHARWIGSRGENSRSIVLSTDKDLCQLVATGAEVRDHFKNEWHDTAWIRLKFGVNPAQLGDFLALTGDASDGVPGVPGVGGKTAAKLLNEHGTLDAVLAAAPSIKGALGAKLQQHAELARTSRLLVSFKTDVGLGLTWNSMLAPCVPE
jgi:protein Xni